MRVRKKKYVYRIIEKEIERNTQKDREKDKKGTRAPAVGDGSSALVRGQRVGS